MLTHSSRISLACALLCGCGSVPADRYQAPPKDGSVNANSADVVDNPGIVPNDPKLGKANPNRYQAPPKDGSVNANSADVVDNPGIVPAANGSGEPTKGMGATERPSEYIAATTMKGFKYIDPITGEPVGANCHVGYYGQWQVRFNNPADAAQFASLPKAKRDKLAAPQVLAQKGITNTVCPLTGATLTAAAAPVKVDGAVVGFATMADANQFRSLKKAKQDSVIEAWKKDGAK